MNLTGFQSFEDHHPYSLDNIESLYSNGLSSGAQALITTEKDLVKIRDLFPRDFPLLTLSVRLEMDNAFDRFLLNNLENS